MSKRPEIIESPILARLERWRAENERREAERAMSEREREAMDLRFKRPPLASVHGKSDWRVW